MNRVKELESKIIHYSQLYYEGKDTISDAEFDYLVDQLKKLDPCNIILHATGWGYKIPDDERKVSHPMVNVGGLDKCKANPDTVLKFKSATPKYDGASVELIYSDNKLISAITRGTGETGQRVTEKLIPIVGDQLVEDTDYSDNIPHNVLDWLKTVTISISGEFILSKKSLMLNYPDEISHRNIPSGFLNIRSREISDEECRRFDFIPYRINAIISDDFSLVNLLNNRRSMQTLLNQLFSVNVPYSVSKDPITYEDLMKEFVSNSDYNFDGIVANNSFTFDFSYVNEMNGSHKVVFKYDEIAYKIVTDIADVVVKDIDWNLTRTARLIPVIEYDPVELSGAICERATAHNAEQVFKRGLNIGATVRITRSGEVIPFLLDVIEPVYSTKDYYCPSCNHKLSKVGVDLKCTNPDCISKSYNRVLQWLSYLGWVKNAGGSLYDAMIEYGELEDVKDLYTKTIDWSSMINIPGMGFSKMELVNKIIKKIHEPMRLSWVLVGSNLTGISSTSATKLENESNLLECIRNNTPDKFTTENVKGLGSSVYNTIINNWKRIIDNCSYIELISPSDANTITDDSDKLKISVTGRLNYGTRGKLFKDFSHKIKEVDLKDALYLVTNNPESGSSKNRNAQKLGVKIITEDELFNIIKE